RERSISTSSIALRISRAIRSSSRATLSVTVARPSAMLDTARRARSLAVKVPTSSKVLVVPAEGPVFTHGTPSRSHERRPFTPQACASAPSRPSVRTDRAVPRCCVAGRLRSARRRRRGPACNTPARIGRRGRGFAEPAASCRDFSLLRHLPDRHLDDLGARDVDPHFPLDRGRQLFKQRDDLRVRAVEDLRRLPGSLGPLWFPHVPLPYIIPVRQSIGNPPSHDRNFRIPSAGPRPPATAGRR